MIFGFRIPKRTIIKVLPIFLVLSFFLHSQNPSSIVVQRPNGGEQWQKGSIQTISWTSTNLRGLVKLVLIKGEKLFGEIELNCPAKGSYSWVVGDCPVSGVTAEPGRDFRLRVVSLENASIRDDSNASFQIISPPSS